MHDTTLGPALGGCRMWNYATAQDALSDALRLSAGMTAKSALVGMPFGGGKAVIMGDSRTKKTPEMMRAFGRFVESLDGRYFSGEDVGIIRSNFEPLVEWHLAKWGRDWGIECYKSKKMK